MGDRRDWLFLMGKSLLVILGGVLLTAGLVDLVVDGYSHLSAGILTLGLLLAVPPMALAFRDALREARKGRI